jgi:chorismate-pyruvate lyase
MRELVKERIAHSETDSRGGVRCVDRFGSSASFLIVPDDDSSDSETKRRLWRYLSPMERALMATDGSFTLLLSALRGERIEAEVLWQSTETLRKPDTRLQLNTGGQILVRHTLLKTAESGQPVAYAESQLVPSRLSKSIRQELENGTKPIGLLLRSEAVETHRELDNWGDCTTVHHTANRLASRQHLFRTYKVISHALPLMTVTECFPQLNRQRRA